ncbi:MAG: lipocalin-like domain-containing protein [Muribaculaceae bacterium]|nr:lipocalin-like domain-containing protein [Muribaculaceae bacterium]
MTRIVHLVIMCLAIACGSCTHNDGDIGPLFGTWVLDEMSVDGTVQELGPDHTFMQFQGAIALTKLIDDRHSLLAYCIGSWERDNNAIFIDYTHRDDNTAAGEGQYSAPWWLLLTSNAINRLDIISLDSKHMHLQHISTDGATVDYKFRKTF